jgi:hypothetical protein
MLVLTFKEGSIREYLKVEMFPLALRKDPQLPVEEGIFPLHLGLKRKALVLRILQHLILKYQN